MELRQGGQTLVGYPALIDKGAHVEIEVFDEPEVAAEKHRAGLRRLVALQVRDSLKYAREEPARPAEDGDRLPAARHADELRAQIVEVALDRAFLAEPLPADAADFARRIDEGRGRMMLIANEVARLAGVSPGRLPRGVAQTQGHAPGQGRRRRHRPAARAPRAQALHRRHAVGASGAPAALSEGDRRAPRQAARRSGPRRRSRRRPAPARAALPAKARRAARRARRRGSTSSAGGSRSCGSACSRRS